MTKDTNTTTQLSDRASALGFSGDVTCAVQVSDIEKSIAWYQDVLGFELIYHVKEIGWCEMASPVNRLQLGLSQVEKPNVKGVTLTWGVNDIEAARKKLEQSDVRFDGPTQEIPDMVKLATFYDPDGNNYMLNESLSDEMPN